MHTRLAPFSLALLWACAPTEAPAPPKSASASSRSAPTTPAWSTRWRRVRGPAPTHARSPALKPTSAAAVLVSPRPSTTLVDADWALLPGTQ